MASGFAVSIKAVDLASGPIKGINLALDNLGKNAKRVAREGGLFQARDALRKIKDQAESVGEGLAKVFSPLGGLAGAGSVGGLALLAERFARVNSEMVRTSATLGLSTADLKKWSGAADLAGVGADAMTTSISGVAQGIYRVRNGLDPSMFRVAQRWGLDLNKGTTDAEKGMNTILQVAHKIRNDPALKGNVQAQRTLLEQLHIDPRMLWLMQQGEQKMREFAEISRQHLHLTDQQYDASMRLQFAYAGLTQSVGGFTDVMSAGMSKWMTPMLNHMASWIDKLKETPGAMKAIELGGDALFITAAARWLPWLLRLVGNVTGLTTALTFLTKIPGFSVLGPLGAFAGTLWGGPLNEGEPNLMRYRHGGGIKVDKRIGLQLFQMGMTPGLPPLPYGEGPAGNEAAFNYGNLRAPRTPAAANLWQRFRNPAEGILAEANLLNRYQSEGIDTLRKIITKLGPPNENDTEGLIRRASGFLRIDPEQRLDLNNDPQLMARVVEAMFRNERGGRLPSGLTPSSIGSVLGLSPAGLTGMGPQGPWARTSEAQPFRSGLLQTAESEANKELAEGKRPPGYPPITVVSPVGASGAVMVGRGHAPAVPGIAEPVGGLARGWAIGPQGMLDTSGSVMIRRGYAPAVPSIAESGGGLARGGVIGTQSPPPSYAPAVPSIAGPSGGGAAGPQSLDTSHRVEVHFVNAPPGMRSGLTKSEGPAEVSVRTHYSLDNLS